MIESLMMDEPLLLSSIIDYAASYHGDTEVVSRSVAGEVHRYGYREAYDRMRKLGRALQGVGLTQSDRVASLCWNTHQHFELFYAVPCVGGVLHTVNPRLSEDHVVYIVNHGGAKILLFDSGCADLVGRIRSRLSHVETVVYINDGPAPLETQGACLDYEALIAASGALAEFPTFDEKAAAILCYTSGTTGNPKGVLYSHRSLVLIALASIAKDFFGGYRNGALDVYMPIAGMFHATGWSFPHTAPLCGAKLVLPGRQHDPAVICMLMQDEHVTIAGAVPTVLLTLCDWLDRNSQSIPSLQSLLTSGSAVPQSLIERWEQRHGVSIVQTWGMTESLCSSKGSLKPGLERLSKAEQLAYKGKSGRASWGTRLRLVEEDGRPVPHDGVSVGAMQARGPWTASGYYNETSSPLSRDGWLVTGDMATIDPEGYIEIKDRAKDIIKSGGEWISSAELEELALTYPGARYAAVIGIPHPKWQERPLLVVQQQDDEMPIDPASLLNFIGAKVAKWWIPERVEVIAEMPLSATGKILKTELRKLFPA
ncbi:MAG: long-chain fatty acid--CoA ligase [Rhodopseudomonas sp.]|uniref:long-chain fatty acid--CoA ligase n=1 Tax=Rhodopseudomonas sp. TaxID=1078 RepID=UPI0017A5D650|nr:long-chain fatty acid--CoA ligase [Rhodopseudomonas sp.]NVN87791.1 long-chain fatty acid--CoA ligase [Rhodopseudomonas sp.]